LNEPYLEEGEAFVVTASRISVDFRQYDMLLTSKNLILLDSTQSTIAPWKIPLRTVLAVNAGKTATGEPVITLAFIRNGGDAEPSPMNLLFSQKAGEMRRAERDDWVKRLVEQVVALKQGNLLSRSERETKESFTAAHIPVMRGIDIPLPHKSVIGEEPVLIDLKVVPEENHEISPHIVPETDAKSKRPVDDEEREARGEDSPLSTPEFSVETGSEENEIAEAGLSRKGNGGMAGMEPGVSGEHAGEPEPVPEVFGTEIPAGVSEPLPEPEPVETNQLQEPETVPLHEPIISAISPELSPEQKTMDQGPQGEPEPSREALPEYPSASWPSAPPEISREILEEISKDAISEDLYTAENEAGPKKENDRKTALLTPPGQFPAPRTLAAVAIIIIVLLAIACGILFSSRYIPHETGTTLPPDNDTANIPTSPSVALPTPVVIPADGTWLLVNGSFSGDYGRPGNKIHITNSGQVIYRIGGDIPLFQVTFRNQDNSGNLLLVEVYNNGTRVLSRSTSAPGGIIEFIIDPKTGEFPRATPTRTSWTGLSPGVTYRT